ncbi:MAG TPA: YbaK/EbsC family protein [Candidatus Limnocylindrales bacterium]|nr:YbaK/EbsC family protein [Candidatus Limnocylindrales bacterium]
MTPEITISGPLAGLQQWLAERDVDFDIHEHDEAFSATSTALAEGVDVRTFAKVVGVVTDDGRAALLVLDADDRLDLDKASTALDAKHVRLLTEAGLAALTPGCLPGAVPAVGELFQLPMIADLAVRDDAEISFNAGTHRHSVRVDRPAWERATGVRYADLAAEDPDRPAWAS